MEHLKHYGPGHLESGLVGFYLRNHVRSPQDIQLEMFAGDAGIHVYYVPFKSKAFEMARRYR